MSESSRRAAVEHARSFLFVPGNRPDRFAKAQASGADVTILDLEDAVAPGDKEASRGPWSTGRSRHDDCIVRVNGVGTPWIAGELRALRGSGVPVMLPKTDSVDDVAPGGGRARQARRSSASWRRRGASRRRRRWPRAERWRASRSATSTSRPHSASTPHRRPHCRTHGGVSCSPVPSQAFPRRSTGCRPASTTRRHSRATLAHGTRAGLRRASSASILGRSPRSTLRWVRVPRRLRGRERVLAQAQDGVAVIDGAMVDAPVVARARQIVERAARS